MQKAIVTTLLTLVIFSIKTIAQETIYFNADWKKTSKVNAVYYRPLPKQKTKGKWVVDYFISGEKAQEVYHVNGKKDGMYSLFYKTGELKTTGKYINGKKEGIWKTFSKHGKIKEKGKYQNGEKVGIWKTFYKNI